MRQPPLPKTTLRLTLFLLWAAIFGLMIWQLNKLSTSTTSTVAPADAAGGREIINDVSSGSDLQGSSLPLDVGTPQQTAQPNN